MSDWSLIYDEFVPEQEGLREALCTLGNGYFATRGAADEAQADDIHYPGTYVAGGYNRLNTEIAGQVLENEDLVNLPNWLFLTFRPEGGDWFNLRGVEILAYRQELNVKHGILSRTVRFRDHGGRETSMRTRRLVHMRNPHLAATEMQIRPENWSGNLEVRSVLDGRVINAGVQRYRELNSNHLAVLERAQLDDETVLLVTETSQSRLRVAQAARTRVFSDGISIKVERSTHEDGGHIAQELRFPVKPGEWARIEKVVAFHTSRDRAIADARLAAHGQIAHASDFDDLLESHTQAWRLLWDRCDIIVKDGGTTQMVLRLHIFHLLQTASLHSVDLDAGVPARGLHGEAYRGHIFWDELFILPFLNMRFPEISRSLLLYRYRRLPAARRLAKAAGHRGAMYPWQSGSSGREESQLMHLNPRSGRWTEDNSHLQRHVSAAIAFNVWRYCEWTGDESFLSDYGTEMLIEIARFWASVATYNEEDKRYEIRGVMGPDEFHDQYPWSEEPGLNNNSYTNVMAAWVLLRAADALKALGIERRRELEKTLGLDNAEIKHWREVASKMKLVFIDGGILAQFEGYDRLEEFDWDGYRKKYGDIQRLDRILDAEGDSANRYKVSKQADVLMLFYLFSSDELKKLFRTMGYDFEPAIIEKTIEYYLKRTSDGSTLSRVVHSWVVARQDRVQSGALFDEALLSDVADIQGGTTAEGVHLGAMAGTVDLIQRGQLALEISDRTLSISPCLPEELSTLHTKILYHGSWLHIEVQRDKLRVSAPHGWNGPKKIRVRNVTHPFRAGHVLLFDCHLSSGGFRPKPDEPERQELKS